MRRPWPPQHSRSQHEEARTGTGQTLPKHATGAPVPQSRAPATARPGPLSPWASGSGGRQDVTDALRSLMLEGAAEGQPLIDVAMNLTTDDIARHLYTAGRPDPDLVIRTSGEQRIKLPALAERVRPS